MKTFSKKKVTVVQVFIGSLGMIHKSVEEYLQWVEIIEWIALPKTNRKIFYKKRLLEYKWVFFLLSFDLWRKPPPIAIYVLTHWVNDYMWWHQTGQSHAKTKTKKKRYLNALKHKKIAHRRVERSVQVDNNVKRTESEKKNISTSHRNKRNCTP